MSGKVPPNRARSAADAGLDMGAIGNSVGDAPGARINHNITVGFDGADIYVYDPWPRAGDQLMRLGSAERQIRVYFEQDGRPLNWTLARFVPAARAPGGRPAR